MTPLVEVLLSTYDGEKYVREQLDSILAQTHPRLRVVVRDDGSRDGTVPLLREAALGDERVQVRCERNLGLPQAFFHLLDESGDDADLWALSDQDDVWLPTKLARAVARLSSVQGPALYCARVAVVGAALEPRYLHELPWRGPSLANALVQNIALGCTVVLNREARDLVRARWPRECVMHDAWLYLVLAACGTVVYDVEPVVLYRQHAANTVGMGRDAVSRTVGRVRRQLSVGGAGKHGRQDAELLRVHGAAMHESSRQLLRDFLAAQESRSAVLRDARVGVVHRQTAGSDLVLRALRLLRRV